MSCRCKNALVVFDIETHSRYAAVCQRCGFSDNLLSVDKLACYVSSMRQHYCDVVVRVWVIVIVPDFLAFGSDVKSRGCINLFTNMYRRAHDDLRCWQIEKSN